MFISNYRKPIQNNVMKIIIEANIKQFTQENNDNKNNNNDNNNTTK